MRTGKGQNKGKTHARVGTRRGLQGVATQSDLGESRSVDLHGDSDNSGLEIPRALSAATPTMPVSAIKVGDRERIDYGDVIGLAESINKRGGLLQPIAVTPDGELIAGGRRLQAWALSRYREQPIPVHIINVDDIAAGEFDENEQRKDFTLSEKVRLWRKVEERFQLKEQARERMRQHGGTAPGQASTAEGGPVRIRDKIRIVTGKGARTMEKAIAIVEAAERDPAKYAKLVDDMDRNGADGTFKRLRNMQAAERIRTETPPLPMAGPYRVIAVDPPWEADLKRGGDPSSRGYYPYPTMSIDDICALPVQDIVHPEGCALWLWVNNFRLANGDHVKVLDAWGFTPSSTVLTWIKTGIGLGQRLRGASEHCVLAVRGHMPPNAGADATWFEAPVTEHSEKPQKFFEIVERVTPAPRYAMLFAGHTVPPNWDGHGDRIGTQREAAE